MPGKLKGDEVLVEDQPEASQLYTKGYFGLPQSGGSLKLDLLEAIYLTEAGKLKVYRSGALQNQDRLFRLGTRLNPKFDVDYIVYRDLRQRGYVVKKGAAPLTFRVLPRGGIPNKNPSKYWVLAISERGEFDVSVLADIVDKDREMKKELLLAVVAEEGDFTYYRTKIVIPQGHVRSDAQGNVAEALLLRDRVLVLDDCEAQVLHQIEYFGKLVGSTLHLSLLETAFLMDRGLIRVRSAKTGKFMAPETLKKMARKAQPDFDLRLQIYADLKRKGILVKTGFKYGSHFRAYTGDPEVNHAKYLVHSIPENYVGMWAEISRAVRLAHGVKKEILLGRATGESKAQYLRLRRVRP